jgi:hypothetical protein
MKPLKGEERDCSINQMLVSKLKSNTVGSFKDLELFQILCSGASASFGR